jgi:hypothetical protein
MAVANTLAYLDAATIVEVEGFIVQTPAQKQTARDEHLTWKHLLKGKAPYS